MTMPIQELMTNTVAQVYCDQAFRDTVESVLNIIKVNPNNRTMGIEPGIAYKYEFDFYGLLSHLKIPTSMHWLTLRVNGYRDPRDYVHTHVELVIPSEDDLTYVRRMYKTRKGTL